MLDTRDTGSWGSENGHLVVMKNYPPQFKADAVALYESRPEATIRSVRQGKAAPTSVAEAPHQQVAAE